MSVEKLKSIIDLLETTIRNKENLKSQLGSTLSGSDHEVFNTVVDMNISELNTILKDLTSAYEGIKTKSIEDSWRDNPDRMGGQFTQEEINDRHRWR